MKVLFISNLFPNAQEPVRGLFNAQQVAALSKQCTVVKVIAPLPRAAAPERFASVAVTHPRFWHVPLLSRPWNGWLFARAAAAEIAAERFDVALVNWAYPDAYGVMLVAQQLKFPFATTVQGSDVNLGFRQPGRKRQILRALRASRAVFTRSQALQQRLANEGIEAVTVYNGIDHQRFRPTDRAAACAALRLPVERRRILYVGNLQPVKGPTFLATAFELLRDCADVDLVLLGSGPEARRITAGPRTLLVGSRRHEEIPTWMNAADLLCVPSLNEGLPNVALEAMACGLPVVASRVGGLPEIVAADRTGLLVPAADPPALAAALRRALTRPWDKALIRQSVAQFDWDTNAQTVITTLEQILAN